MRRVLPKFSAKILATTSSTYPRGQTVYCQSFKNIIQPKRQKFTEQGKLDTLNRGNILF